MDPTIGLLAGTGWASGVNLYGVVLLLGILGRLGVTDDVPALLLRPEVMVVAAGLYLIEFVADKIPYVDDAWDVIHTAVRPLGAAVLGVLLAGEDVSEVAAALGTGGLAFASHAVKATARVAINTSPEPVSNSMVSLAEDGLVAGVVALAVTHPLIALGVVAFLLIAGIVVLALVVRAARRGLVRWRTRHEERRARRREGAKQT